MKRVASLFSVCAVSGALSLAACGDGGGGDTCTTPTTGMTAKFAVKSLVLPNNGAPATKFAFDLNGDGKPDNQLAAIITALGAAGSGGPMPQASVNTAVSSGNLVVLFNESAAALDNNDCAATTLQAGTFAGASAMPAVAPKFDGTDTFAINAAVGSGTFKGAIKSSVFTSNSPVTTKSPVTVTLGLPLTAGTPIPLTVSGARITFTKTATGATGGQINGAVKFTDVKTTIIPAVADLLTDQVKKDPAGMPGTIANLFDTYPTGCKAGDLNRDGSVAAAGDQKIAVCEVENNSLIKSVLIADVQLYAADGVTWAPNKDNTTKDSMSLGLGFELVNANF